MQQLNPTEIRAAIAALSHNEIVILPTDTIYGISAIVSEDNARRINTIKKSALDKPLIILISNLEQASQFVTVDEVFTKNIQTTDPTTVISKKVGADTTYALRLVSRPDLQQIIEAVGPIYSTSVNVAGNPNLSRKEELLHFSDAIFQVFFTENLIGKPSKILNLSDFSKKRWHL
jgi:L-threonylcarbamoyladenylate synthase